MSQLLDPQWLISTFGLIGILVLSRRRSAITADRAWTPAPNRAFAAGRST
jgi:hypothetical protein